MPSTILASQKPPPNTLARWACIGAILIFLAAAHNWSPVETHQWHTVHVLLRKLFFLPVVLTAIWFGFSRAIVVAGIITAYYVPYIFLEWQGQFDENVNQLGEIGTVWLTAVLAGALAQRERRALERLAATHEGALIALVSALDAREHDTQLHSLRVREFSLLLGSELGMDRDELRVLGEAALLHDVGKIGVPDEILLKPGSLTEAEWERMRDHPAIGRRILTSIESLGEAAEVVYAHHEHYDGSGYPQNLAGDAIPFGARVFAVVDAFDAIVSSRPYEKAMTLDDARDRIAASSGTQFDPQVVQTFLKVRDREWLKLARNVEAFGTSSDIIGQTLPSGEWGAIK